MAVFKTLQFLPEIFRTDTNRKFLNATTDQLISEPDFYKINGYIGRQQAPSFKNTDSYITEPTKQRQDYQLEPSIVIKNPNTNNLLFATTYADIINKINFYGGFGNNHNRLFDNEFYSYDPQIDLDKFINFAQYYWLENGPAAVTVTASTVPLEQTFGVTFDSTLNTYKFLGSNNEPNPLITLARGGRYIFEVNEPGNKFYIQSSPGSLGVDPNAPNLTTRSVLGVTGNGKDVGTVVFQVPLADAQVQWTNMPLAGSVTYATSLSYQTLQGCLLSELQDSIGGIDGPSSSLNGVSLIFINAQFIDDTYWHNTARVDDDIIYLDQDTVIPFNERNDIYQIAIYNDNDDNPRVYLTKKTSVTNEQKVRILSGTVNAGKEFYSRLDIYFEVPSITAPQNLLYYQSDQSDNAIGAIQLIDPTAAKIDPASEIVGQLNYISPNGVAFTNGLKVTFDSTALEPYNNNTYYVEGVGQAIKLILVSDLVVPELDNLSDQDYITINRSSIDLNGWTRSNRWFHVDIIEKTAIYNGFDLVLNQEYRAQRPIIEFNADLQLYNFGTEAKVPIDLLDDVITNAYLQVQGILCISATQVTVTVNGKSITLTHGDRIVFSQDENLDVRNKIFDFSIVVAELPTSITPVYRAYIQEADDAQVDSGHTIIVKSGTNGEKQWHYNGTSWIESQQKTKINQEPLFDIIDQNGISFSDYSSYPGSQFYGTKILSYKRGTGQNDAILNFPLSYKNLLTQGDIQFENNYDIDKFSYLLPGGISKEIKINTGVLQKNLSRNTSIRLNNWTINNHFSKQYQVFKFTYDGVTNLFPIDILPDITVGVPNVKVIINNQPVKLGRFAITNAVNKLAILVDPSLLTVGDVIFINIFSKQSVSNTGFYQVPVNLDINSLNTNIENLTLGQLRNHLIQFKNNSLDIEGDVPGKSNIRDIDYTNRGGSILQHSAPTLYSGLFLNHPTMNLFDSLRLASREYNQFKNKFLDLAYNLDLDRRDVAGSVDTIMGVINSVKTSSFPWLYSDMIPHGNDDRVVLPTYKVFDTDIREYEITNIFQDTELSNKAVLVYNTRTLEGVTTTTLLVKGQDYYFNQTRPSVVIQPTYNLLYEDLLTIVEYNNTDGSYVPETPTKLGLYPKFIPKIYLDDTYRVPQQVIQGHDGSITPAFGDFRDNLLLELERRIYNNIKTEYDVNIFNINDYLPGKFRILDYNLQEFNQLLSTSFLRWAGTNRVDFITNSVFEASDAFTWNYKKFRDVINGESLPGSWRSVFRYFFDTDRPHTDPWEMLGFSEKPDYWEDRYGPAPYTGGNFVLWSDLEAGYIHSGARAGIDLRYSRPGLTSIIPVDDSGNLRSPAEFLVTNFDSARANASFAVGDIGPTELAWRRSSDFPYAMQLALAIGKPSRYFSLLTDVKKYNRNAVLGQFLDNETNNHLQPQTIRINGYEKNDGTIERSAGYINWIRDYIKSTGVDAAADLVRNAIDNIQVQLTYKMAGYSDKRFLELLAEQISPSSINDSIVIPDENYSIELYKGSPLSKISYSAVIVEKSSQGYTVSGYDINNPYFKIVPSIPNNNAYTINASGRRATIFKDSRNIIQTIPYGFEFANVQQVVDFLVSYQRYLISQGFIFVDRDNLLGENKDFVLSAKEFLHWSSQGWRQGNIIVLSPINDNIKIFNQSAVVDEVVNTPSGSRIIDINYVPIIKNNFTVVRESGQFSIKSLKDQTIGFAEFNFVQYEHILLFDNTTVFKDVIYLPETGNRQYRLKIIGSKTNQWNGSLELPGFIYSSTELPNWQSGVDYLKGTIVNYKQRFYTALQDIIANDTFQVNNWKLIQDEIKTGVFNNFATNAGQAQRYYDINDQPVDEQIQLLSNGLIGFRPRQYFTNLGIDITTQSKFYQGLVKQGGTLNAVNALRGAKFNNLATQPLNIFENWAIRVGEYGATEINQFLEVILADKDFTNNPAVFQLSDSAADETDIKTYSKADIYKSNLSFSNNFLRIESVNEPQELKSLPVAGFVNLDDVDITTFDISTANNSTLVKDMGVGYTIWTAKDTNDNWNVFRATSIPGVPFILRYSIDDKAELVNSAEHGLIEGDLIALKNFDDRYNGIYKVNSIIDSTRILITITNNLQNLIDEEAVISNGLLYLLRSSVLQTPVDLVNSSPYQGWLFNDKVWVKNLDNQGNWGVYQKLDPWNYESKIQLGESQYTGNDHFGRSLAIDGQALFLYGGAPDSGTGRVSAFARNINNGWDSYGSLSGTNPTLDSFGKVLATATTEGRSFVAIGAPDSTAGGVVYIFENQILVQILANDTPAANDQFGAALAMSDDARYLYVGSPGSDKVFCYTLDYPRQTNVQIITSSGASAYTLNSFVADEVGLVAVIPALNLQYFPYINYSIALVSNGISAFTSAGTAFNGITTFAVGGSGTGGAATFLGVTATGGSGTGATFDVSKDSGGAYTVTIANGGSNYQPGDILTIAGTSVGGIIPTHNITITVQGVNVDNSYYGVTATGGTGSGAKFFVEKIGTNYTLTLENGGTGYTNGDTLTIAGTSVGGSSTANDITITVSTVGTVTNLVFASAPAAGLEISIIQRPTYYTNFASISGTNGSNYGSALVCNAKGYTFALAADNTVVNNIAKTGSAETWHTAVVEITTNGLTNTFTLPYDLGVGYRVYLNNQLIYNVNNAPVGVSALYSVIGSNIIQYGDPGIDPLPSGNVFKFELNQIIYNETLYPEFAGIEGQSFGSTMSMCNTGCNLYVSSPNYKEPNYVAGMISRYQNIGRVYGVVVGTVSNPTVTLNDRLSINNVIVTFTGTSLTTVVNNINGANIPGVVAAIQDNKLKITSDVKVAAEKLNILNGNLNGTALHDLGIEQYQFVQAIRHPQDLGETFGTALAVDQENGVLVVGSNGADITTSILIDSTLAIPTLFDSGGTNFVDYIPDSGAVYVYNLMPNPFENQDNPRLYAYSQKLVGPNLETGFNFGAALAVKGEYLTAGVSNDYDIVSEGGSIYFYFNENAKSGWNLLRSKEPRVDIGAVNSSFIYNTVNQNIIDFFDYIDPAKGKLLGIVDQELDFKEEYDPASYNNSSRADTVNNKNFYWSDKQVTKTWLDLSTLSFIDYEQGSIQYRVKNWGALFPGSQVTIYEWVESNFLPSQYATSVGDGVAKYPDDTAYSTVTLVDPVTGIISQKYYYWVSGKTTVDVTKALRTISTKALESYITNPKDQDIPYLALLTPGAVAIYNVTDSLSGNNMALYLNLASIRNANLIHNEWQLIQQGAGADSIPFRAISKLRDSLSGFDINNAIVPDPLLSVQDKLGILSVPRQSLILDRLTALENYVLTFNSIVKKYPILLIRTPSTLYLQEPLPLVGFDTKTESVIDLTYLDTQLLADGYRILVLADSNYQGRWSIYQYNSSKDSFEMVKLQSYQTNLFWNKIDWYADSYQIGKDINYTVNIYSDTQALNLAEGNYIKILDGGQGTWIIYEVLSDGSFELIAAQNGTLQINSTVYDVLQGSGYDSIVYDSNQYDLQPTIEFQNIYDSVYKEILIEDLSIELNNLFLTIVNYVFAEQKNPDWIIKTSFVDVYHNLRALEEFPNYVKDNQSFYLDYINEVKPFRTIIREYVPLYDKQDISYGDWTDFDLPSAYDKNSRVYKSPNINDPQDANLFSNDLYNDWANNYKFKISDYIIGNIGLNYTLPPNVEITGGGGTGAAAITTIFGNGRVSGITVVNPGSGYTSTPNVFINGDGVGATAYPLLKNEYYASQGNLSYNLVRSFNTSIKLDRIDYTSNVVQWQANTAYANTVVVAGNTLVDSGNVYITSGNIVIYQNQAYLATNANITSQTIFDFSRYTKIDNGNVLLNALDRILAYYDPATGMSGKNIQQLVTGTGYPGNYVQGSNFRANAFEVTSNIISFNYEGLTIDSANIAQFDFVKEGFEIDQSIRISANVPFEFQNNGYFTIVNVNRDSMTLTGQPVETTYNVLLDNPVTVVKGSYITQSNSLANARVLQSVVNSNRLSVIYSIPEFTVATGNISINGTEFLANITELTTGGNVEATIAYLNLATILDTGNIYSFYLDSNLGIRPQDINIVGGAYVDRYSSHAPEELVPGRMYDALELRVFSNTVGNTATYGYRAFHPMSANIEYTRISANATTTLASNLKLTDDEIVVVDATKLPTPAPSTGTPGIVFINGERIVYYQKYDLAKISTAIPWTANTQIASGTLITLNGNVYLTTGNVYANASVYVNSANIQQITVNSLRQLRRGVDGTGAANIILAGNTVSDSSFVQFIPNAQIYTSSTVTGNVTATANVTFKLILSANITANVGDYLTQFVGNTANVRILETVVSSNVVAVGNVFGLLKTAANVGTRINLASLTSGVSSTTANVLSITPLGTVYANGNVVLSGVSLLRSNIWEQFSTTLENSTTVGAQFIRSEPSYIP